MKKENKLNWLICDFHIHTNMSDGKLSLKEVIDLYGSYGIDVISITDHVIDEDTFLERLKNKEPIKAIRKEDFSEYLKLLWKEQKRAWKEYKMLLIPGVEISNNKKHYHILAIDIKEFIDPSLPVEEIIEKIKEQNAVSIAAHPEIDLSLYLWNNREKFKDLFDAWEIANRDRLFNSVALEKYKYVANSDFHEFSHIYSWKTLIKTEKNIEAIKESIRENKEIGIYLMKKI